MWLRFRILRTEAKLFFLLVSELFILNPAVHLLVIEFPMFLLLLWFVEGIYLIPIAVYILILLACVIIRNVQLTPGNPPADAPLSKPLDLYPELRERAKAIASRWRKSAPRSVSMSLSPTPWHPFGVNLHRSQYFSKALTAPISCLDTWSITEFEAHIARTLVFHRGPAWLVTRIESAIERLAAEQLQQRRRKVSDWIVRARARALQRYTNTFTAWRVLVEMEADLKVASVLGSGTLMSLTYKTALAHVVTPAFINSVIEPAIDQHALLPIADSYAAYASAVDPHWRDAVDKALKEIHRSSRPKNSLVARLAVLSTLPAGATMVDPRPAKTLFPDFKTLEREVAANEFGAQRIESAADVDAENSLRLTVIPQLRDEVARNSALFEGKTRFDIPQLLIGKASLAEIYKPNPKFLLAHVQREQRIPYLLGAFLALNMIDEHWDVHYEINHGIELRLGQRLVQPFTLVKQLDAKTISATDFAAAVK